MILMNTNNHRKLYQSGLAYKSSPSPEAWSKLNEKMSQNKKTSKPFYFTFLWVAATIVAILGVLAVINIENLSIPNQNSGALTHLYSEQIEVLEINNEPGIYEIQKMEGLKMAYKKLNAKSGM